MPANDPLWSFAHELSERLEQFGLQKRRLEILKNGPEKYCTVARLKIAGAQSNVVAFQGPYFRGKATLWAGFASRSGDAIEALKVAAGRKIQFCAIGYGDWGETYILPETMLRKVASYQNFAEEDYRKDTKWIWLGRYFKPQSGAASSAASFIAPAARSLIYGDVDESYPDHDGPTETTFKGKRRLVQGAFRKEVARRAKGRCAVTGCTTPSALRASHILAWSDHPKLRANPDNGLYLVGTLDALFDRGRISFDRNGKIMISDVIPPAEWKLLGLKEDLQIVQDLTTRQKEFLKLHRERKFLKF